MRTLLLALLLCASASAQTWVRIQPSLGHLELSAYPRQQGQAQQTAIARLRTECSYYFSRAHLILSPALSSSWYFVGGNPVYLSPTTMIALRPNSVAPSQAYFDINWPPLPPGTTVFAQAVIGPCTYIPGQVLYTSEAWAIGF